MRSLIGLLVLLGSVIFADWANATVEDWFEDEAEATLQSYAPSVFADLGEDELRELTIGDPVSAVALDENSTDPRVGDGTPDSYAAPISLEDDIVGVITYGTVGDEDDEANVYSDPYFGEAIVAMQETDVLIVDPENEAHYIVRDDRVIPVSASALDQLAGSTTIESFLELRRSLHSDSQAKDDAATASDTSPVIVAGVVLVIFLVSTVLFTWLRRSPTVPQPPEISRRRTRQVRIYRRGGTRVNADD